MLRRMDRFEKLPSTNYTVTFSPNPPSGLGFRDLGFRDLGFRDLGFRVILYPC